MKSDRGSRSIAVLKKIQFTFSEEKKLRKKKEGCFQNDIHGRFTFNKQIMIYCKDKLRLYSI